MKESKKIQRGIFCRMMGLTVLPVLLAFSMESAFAVDLEKLARDDWREFRSPHFLVVSDADADLAETFVRDLENFRFFIAFILKMNLLENVPPVKILAVERRSNFGRLELPDTWSGLFSQSLDGSYALANIHNYQTNSRRSNWGKGVLLHEYVHYAMANTFNRMYYPLWYSEGMAEYLSTFQYDDQKITLGDLDVIGNRFLWLNRTGRYMAVGLEDLFKTKSLSMDPENRAEENDISRFYARATAAVHYFKASDDTPRAMQRYIQLVNEGYEADYALKDAFGRTFDEVDEDIRSYLNSRSMRGLVYKAGDGGLHFPPVETSVKELDEKSMYYYLPDFLIHTSVVSREEKLKILTESLEKNPDNPDLKVMLADYLQADNPEKSEGLLQEVLDRHPTHARARTVYGDLFLNRARLSRSLGLDGWDALLNEARGQYRLSVKSDPFYARAYRGVGNVYTLKTDNDLLEEGAVSLDSARFFANQHELPYLYLLEAILRIRMHDYKNAISTLRGYINLRNGDYGFSPEFGRYVYEAMAYRELSGLEHQREGDRYVYADGSVYTGGWRDGKPNGKGQLVRANGATFKGAWSDGLLAGKGEFISSDGFHYTGDFSNGEITGKGVLVYPGDNEIKESRGEFFSAIEHGEQAFIYRSGERRVARYWMGSANGPERVHKVDGGTAVYDQVFGGYKIELGGDIVYSGSLDEDMKAHGNGACFNKKDQRLYWCKYEHGVEVKKP